MRVRFDPDALGLKAGMERGIMQSYRLKLSDDGIGMEKFIEFEGLDASSALSVLGNENDGRRAELWDGDQLVCTLERDGQGSGFWRINPGDEAI